MAFILPMLCTRLTDLSRLEDLCYVAEPTLAGQRAQVHVAGARTLRCYSRPGRDLFAHPGLAWLREVRWPVSQAVLDGELCAGTGMDWIQSDIRRGHRAEVLS